MDRLARQLFHLSGRYLRTVMFANNLPQGQIMTLKYLMDHRGEPVTPTDLSLEMGIRPPTVTPIIRRLERNGYLERVHSREDRRRVDLSITPEGVKALSRAEETLIQFYGSLLDRLTREEAEELLRLLDKVSDPLPHFCPHKQEHARDAAYQSKKGLNL